jgi:hypothetical protein
VSGGRRASFDSWRGAARSGGGRGFAGRFSAAFRAQRHGDATGEGLAIKLTLGWDDDAAEQNREYIVLKNSDVIRISSNSAELFLLQSRTSCPTSKVSPDIRKACEGGTWFLLMELYEMSLDDCMPDEAATEAAMSDADVAHVGV